MPKIAKKLAPIEVGRLTAAGLHAVGGVAGLHMQISTAGARSWILRLTVGGKRRDVGLGAFPAVSLADAHRKAQEAREQAANGIDPVARRQEAKDALAAKQAARITFDEAARKFITAKSPEWRNPKHVAQWSATLESYASPVIGSIPVGDVGLAHVLQILEPIWTTKNETASRLRGRIENVLDWATVRGFRQGENPARWRGHLDKLLPKPSKIVKVEHHPAVPVEEVAGLIEALRKREGIAARALEFLILTAARSGEIRGATWGEIDLAGKVWTVPASRMKAAKEHRVPLSEQAIKILKALPRVEGNDSVFPAPRAKFMSDMTLTAVMRRMGREEVPHGFRSTFRDWAAERTSYPNHVVEMALAHSIGNAVEAAYRRGDLFEKRVRMMQDWAKFCDTITQAGEVVPIRRKAAIK